MHIQLRRHRAYLIQVYSLTWQGAHGHPVSSTSLWKLHTAQVTQRWTWCHRNIAQTSGARHRSNCCQGYCSQPTETMATRSLERRRARRRARSVAVSWPTRSRSCPGYSQTAGRSLRSRSYRQPGVWRKYLKTFLFVCLGLTSLLNIWGHIATVPACSSGTLTNVLPHRNAMLVR